MAKTRGPIVTAVRRSARLAALAGQRQSAGEPPGVLSWPPLLPTLPATSPHLPSSPTPPATCPLPPVSSQHSNCQSLFLPQSPTTVSCASTHPSSLPVSRPPFLLPLSPTPKPLVCTVVLSFCSILTLLLN